MMTTTGNFHADEFHRRDDAERNAEKDLKVDFGEDSFYCPKCGAIAYDGEVACLFCGLLFAQDGK